MTTDIEPKTGAERQKSYRDSGRQLATVIRDPKAINALDRLTAAHGSQRAAVEFALIDSVTRLPAAKKRRSR